jgi:hypothetical protein
MRRATALLACATLVLAGCGGNGARSELQDAAKRLGKIRSGDLTLRLVVLPLTGTSGRVGFVLRGPFQLRPDALPVANIAYTQLAGRRSATARFVSNGTTAYAVANGQRVSLPASATAQIRSAAAGLGGSGVGGLRIETWVKDPRRSDGGHVGGADTDHVSANLDVVAAANDLLGFVRRLGGNVPTIGGSDADRLRSAVQSSSFDAWIGKRDRLLRRLLVTARLGFGVPQELQRALGSTVGVRVEFELAIAEPNQPVHVTP